MANNNTEIEIKCELENREEVIDFLKKNAKLIIKNDFQKDTYYVPAHRNFLDEKHPSEWLRVRESKKGFSLDYKQFHPKGAEKFDYCKEYETKIESTDAMNSILANLNFKKIVVVEKTRDLYEYKNAEISIDSVKNLGSFIEVEATSHFDNPKEGKSMLKKILNRIGAKVGKQDQRGYPYLILAREGKLNN